MNVPRWLAWGCVGLALLFLAWTEGAAHEQDALTFQNAEQVLARHGAYVHLQDSLRLVERRFVGEEAFWRAKADSLGKVQNVAASLANRDTSKAESVSSNTTQLPATDSLRVVFLGRSLDACDAARGAADSALARCEARGDSLSRALADVLRAKACRFLLFKCPSRSALFIGGAVLGALLENRLSH